MNLTYSRAPNAIYISLGSLTCPSKNRHGAILFIRLFRDTAQFSRLLRYAGILRTHSRPNPYSQDERRKKKKNWNKVINYDSVQSDVPSKGGGMIR